MCVCVIPTCLTRIFMRKNQQRREKIPTISARVFPRCPLTVRAFPCSLGPCCSFVGGGGIPPRKEKKNTESATRRRNGRCVRKNDPHRGRRLKYASRFREFQSCTRVARKRSKPARHRTRRICLNAKVSAIVVPNIVLDVTVEKKHHRRV